MIRPGLLAVLAVVFAPVASSAQMGGMMGGRGGRGGGMMGGMGGMMGGNTQIEQDRAVKIDLTGGQSVSGTIHLGLIVVDSDLGQYAINPEKVRTIRLSKPVGQPVGDNTMPYTTVQGTVITTSGKEIRGGVHIPYWTLEIDDGTLRLVPDKLKSLTFMAEPERKPGERTSAKVPDTKYMRRPEHDYSDFAPGRSAHVPRPRDEENDLSPFVRVGRDSTKVCSHLGAERRRAVADRPQDYPDRRRQRTERDVAYAGPARARRGRGDAHPGPRRRRLRTRPVHLRL